VPPGWTFVTSSGGYFCIADGQTAYPEAYFTSALTDQPGGLSSAFNATFTEAEEGIIVGGASANVVHFRPLAGFEFDNRWQAIYLIVC
jgi:hypothetical protein